MANAASAYVVPTGRYLFAGLTGEDPSGNDEWRGASDIFNTGDPRGPFGSVTDAWNAQRLGLGTLDAPGQLQAALMESTGRYMGGPNNGDWKTRWDQWNATDVTGPDGKTLLSPMHQTGLRVGQSYGARDDQGNPLDPINNGIFQGFAYTQNKLRQNPFLDPTNQLKGYNAATSGYPMPLVSDYTSAVKNAAGGPGEADVYGQRGLRQVQGLAGSTDFDQYGLAGIDRTNALANKSLRKLTRGIDQEAELTLSNKLPEIQQAMEAAGLGRSGAAQQGMLQAQNEIMAQANRDKQRVLADFEESNANRQAGAINLATQQGFAGAGQKFGAVADAMNLGSNIGAQGYEGYAGRMGNAAMAGLGDVFTANEGNRAGARSLWQQAMDRENQRYLGDSGNYLNALQAGGTFANQALEQERLGQSAALQDWFGLQANRDQMRSSSLQEMLTLADQERSIRQQRMNQQLSAGLLPFNTMLQIATGTTGGAPVQYARTDPWSQLASAGIGAIPSLAGQFWNGGQQPQTAEGSSPWL